MYESTRGQSDTAVKAGQAYRNILNAIQEATNSSEQALRNAEVARDEVSSLWFHVFFLTTESDENRTGEWLQIVINIGRIRYEESC